MSGNVCTDDILKIFAISYVIKLMFSSLFGKIMISSSLDRSRFFVQSSDRELSIMVYFTYTCPSEYKESISETE